MGRGGAGGSVCVCVCVRVCVCLCVEKCRVSCRTFKGQWCQKMESWDALTDPGFFIIFAVLEDGV